MKARRGNGILFIILSFLFVIFTPSWIVRSENENQIFLPIVSKPFPTENIQLQVISQTLGANNTVLVSGNYAYLGIGPRVVIIDITNTSAPVVVGQSEILSDTVREISVQGNFIYVAGGAEGLFILDAEDKANPHQIGQFRFGVVETLEVLQNRVYLGGSFGILVVNVSSPTAPVLVKRVDNSQINLDLEIHGSLLYVAAYYGGLEVYDLSNPDNPTLIAKHSYSLAVSLTVSGKYVFITDRVFGFYILDVGDLSSISLAGEFYDNPPPYYYAGYEKISVNNGYAFISDSEDGLHIFDVSIPLAPKKVNTFTGRSLKHDLDGCFIFVADNFSGLKIIDACDPNALLLKSKYDTAPVFDAHIANNYAFLGTGDGLVVLDISNPDSPQRVAHYRDKPLYSVFIASNTAYLGFNDQLEVADLSGFPAITQVGSYPVVNSRDIAGQNNVVFIITFDGLIALDVQSPHIPQFLSYTNLINPIDLELTNRYAYVADRSAGMKIINIEDPAAPLVTGIYSRSGIEARSVSVENDVAVLSDYYVGANVLDVTNPALPTLIDKYNTDCSFGEGIRVIGGISYHYCDASLVLTDIRNIGDFRQLAKLPLPGNYTQNWFRTLEVVGDEILISSVADGLIIIQVEAN